MTAYLIDTNHACAFMNNEQPVTEHITRLAKSGERFYLCMTVIGELYFAVYASVQRHRNLINLEHLLDRIAILSFDLAAAKEYGHIRTELKTKGRPIPGADVQIAAVARLHNLTVLSADHHLTYVDGLQVENWL